MASIFDITLSDDEDPQGIDSEDSDDGFKVCDNFTKEPPKKKFRKESGESSTAEPEILEEVSTPPAAAPKYNRCVMGGTFFVIMRQSDGIIAPIFLLLLYLR